MRDFLAPFDEYTQLVSVSRSSLSLVVLIRKDIMKEATATVPNNGPLDELKRKTEQNIDKRLKVTHAVLMATLTDPSTKHFACSLVTEEQCKPYYDQLAATDGLYCYSFTRCKL